jgi:hypothetical protein
MYRLLTKCLPKSCNQKLAATFSNGMTFNHFTAAGLSADCEAVDWS